jgi:hypothetical protein
LERTLTKTMQDHVEDLVVDVLVVGPSKLYLRMMEISYQATQKDVTDP